MGRYRGEATFQRIDVKGENCRRFRNGLTHCTKNPRHLSPLATKGFDTVERLRDALELRLVARDLDLSLSMSFELGLQRALDSRSANSWSQRREDRDAGRDARRR